MTVFKASGVGSINPDDYKFLGRWAAHLLPHWYGVRWLMPQYAKQIGLHLEDGGILVINGGNLFVKKKTLEAIRKYVKNITDTKDEEKLGTLNSLADSIYKTALTEISRLAILEPTAKNITEAAEAGCQVLFPWFLGVLMSEVIDEFLTPVAVRVGIGLENIPALILPFRTPLQEAQGNLLNIKKKLEDNKDITSLIERHIEEYGWTGIINLTGQPPTKRQLLDQIMNLPTTSNTHPKAVRANDANLAFIIKCAETIAYLRQSGVEYFSIYSRDMMVLLKKTAVILNILYEELLDLTLEEIASGLGGSDVKKLVVKRRGDQWVIYSVARGCSRVISDRKDISKLATKMIPRAGVSADGVIRGQTGNKGKVIGKVKVILTQADFRKMEKGNVLVTLMTFPNFVPLMQKSSAIVTDIGGLLCHAVIMSRELGKPCVIGTKFATQILKDGDLVEVDANSGIVRILKQNS